MKNKISKGTYYIIVSGVLLLSFVLFAIYSVGETSKYTEAMSDYNILVNHDPFQNIDLEAKSAYVFDTKDKKALFSLGSNEVLPLASITKFMTILTAVEALPADISVAITPASLAVEGSSGLYAFEEWRFADLSAFTLIVSSNQGAQAIALAAEPFFQRTEGISFVEKMNKKANHLGMRNSVFYNPTGLDESPTKAGAYSNAEDVTKMVDYLLRLHPNFVRNTPNDVETFRSITGYEHTARNTNQEAIHIPGLTASKTGFTDLAGGNLVIATTMEDGRTIIITVIGSSREGRFRDVLSLYEAAVRYYRISERLSILEDNLRIIHAR